MPMKYHPARSFLRNGIPAALPTVAVSILLTLPVIAGSPASAARIEAQAAVVGQESAKSAAASTITGTVLGPDGSPVAGVDILVHVQTAEDASVDKKEMSKADGAFRIEGLPTGKVTIHVMAAVPASGAPAWSATNPPLIEAITNGVRLTLATAGVMGLPEPIHLARSVAVSGRVTDAETGVGIAGVHVHFAGRNGGFRLQPPSDTPNGTDADGRIRVYLVPNSKYQVNIDAVPAPYQVPATAVLLITSPKTGGADVAVPALAFTLSKKAVTGRSLTGTVLDVTGTPVPQAQIVLVLKHKAPAGAKADAGAQAPSPLGSTSLMADEQGRFVLPNIAPGDEISGIATHPGYRYVSAGPATETEEGSQLTLRLAPLTGIVHGKVVDSERKAVAGALVWSTDGDQRAQTLTDASGAFTLASVPEGTVDVSVAHGSLWVELKEVAGKAATSAGNRQPNTILLSNAAMPASNEPSAKSMLEAMVESKKGEGGIDRSELVNYVAQTDLDTAFALASSVHKEGEALPDGVVANLIEARLKTDPVAAAAWATARVPQMGEAMTRVRSDCEIGMALVYSHPDMAGKWYQSCQADAELPNAAVDMNRARLVALAALLHRSADEATHLKRLDGALDGTQRYKYNRTHCAEQVARGDEAAAEVLLKSEGLPEKIEFYSQLIQRTLKTSPSLSRVYLTKLQEAITSLNATDAQRSVATDRAIAVVAALGPSSPHDALAVAHTISTDDTQFCLGLATAARYQTETVAAPLWQQAIAHAHAAEPGRRAMELIELASTAAGQSTPSPANRARARALWAEASATAAALDYRLVNPSEWAVLACRFDPALARMIIERSFANDKSAPPAFVNRWALVEAVVTMAFVDPARAAALLDAVPEPGPEERSQMARSRFAGDYLVDTTRLWLIRFLALSPERRAALTSASIASGDINDLDGAG